MRKVRLYNGCFESGKGKNMRILYVEDDSLIRDCFAPMLRDGIQNSFLEIATSGFEAIEILRKDSSFDLIVSDFNMPNGDGAELLRYVALEKPACYFILFTNEIDPQLKIKNDNFVGIIHKSRFNQLIRTILDIRNKFFI